MPSRYFGTGIAAHHPGSPSTLEIAALLAAILAASVTMRAGIGHIATGIGTLVLFSLLVRARLASDTDNWGRAAGGFLCWTLACLLLATIRLDMVAPSFREMTYLAASYGLGLAALSAYHLAGRWMAPGKRAAASCGIVLAGDLERLEREGIAERLAAAGCAPNAVIAVRGPRVDPEAALARLAREIRTRPVDSVVLALDPHCPRTTRDVGELLRNLPVRLRLLPDAATAALLRAPASALAADEALDLRPFRTLPAESWAKAILDRSMAAILLIGLSPLLSLISAAIRIESSGPAIFRQTRSGRGGRPFQILKFRTMRVMEDGPEIRQATAADERVTRVGRLLRRSSLDELPQLLNVLHGEMSRVGPRPHALAHDRHYAALIDGYAMRQLVKPGLTGWAQVSGLRGETRDADAMRSRVEHDLWYIANWSLRLDAAILVRTLALVARPGRGAY